MTKTDLIIIGAGPGGYTAAEYAAKKGLTVTIFEDSALGGVCLNCGCIPTKALCHDADIIDAVGEAKAYATNAESMEFALNYAPIAARKDAVIEQLRGGIETLLSQPNITLVRARATFQDAKTILANGESYTADNIIIATGSRPKMPPIKGIDGSNVVTSTELLNVKDVPQRLCIVGAGVIGLEFASVFNSFGSQVTVVEFLKECLPSMDSDIAKRLRKQLEKKGITFYMQSGVTEITPTSVHFTQKGKEIAIDADLVLVATGRAACSDNMGLENAGIQTERGVILTDEHCETNVKGVYAIGDVNAKMMLAHAAEYQGRHVINRILGNDDQIRLEIVPAAVFTRPEAACVGPTEDAAKALYPDLICKKAFYRANGKALSMNETDGLLKLLAKPDGTIIACHVLGPHAADIVQEAAALICMNATINQLGDIIHIHPTLSEILASAAH